MLLSSEDHDRVNAAIAEAETRTSGEIFCVLARETEDHRAVPFAWAALVALLLPPLLLWFGIIDPALLDTGGWAVNESEARAPLRSVVTLYAALSAILFVATFLITNIRALRLRLTPASLRRTAVHRHAMENFLAHGVHVTEARTGILIFLSLADRHVEIIADESIYAKVDHDLWAEAIEALLAHARAGRIADGFVEAVRRCGAVLAENFPPKVENRNELPDRLVEI